MALFNWTLAEHLGTCQSLSIRTVYNTYHVHVLVQSYLIFNFLEVKKITLEFLKIIHFIYSQIKWQNTFFFLYLLHSREMELHSYKNVLGYGLLRKSSSDIQIEENHKWICV